MLGKLPQSVIMLIKQGLRDGSVGNGTSAPAAKSADPSAVLVTHTV